MASTRYSTIVRNALTKPQADNDYLLLDCSNDPLTDVLRGPGHGFDTYDTTEIVLNGGFDTSADWTFGGDWSWNTGGYAQVTGLVGASGNLTPSTPLVAVIGQWYMLTFDCPNMSRSFITPSFGGVTLPNSESTGSYSHVFKATATTTLNFYGELVAGSGKLICHLDNVSLHKIGYLKGYTELLGAELIGTLKMALPGGGDIGEDGTGVRRIWLHDGLTTGANLNVSGLVARFTGGDMAIGIDNIFPGYYVQKTVLHDSVATDNSDDFTNLYQGGTVYRQIAMMYDVPYSASPANGVNIGDGPAVTDPPPLIFGGMTFATGFGLRLDKTNTKFILGTTSASVATYVEFVLTGTDPAVRPDTDALVDLGDDANFLRFRHLYLSGDVHIGQYLEHLGDADTRLNFTDDQIDFDAGGVTFLRLLEDGTQDILAVNPGLVNLDFIVNGDTAAVIATDAAIDGLGFYGATPVAQPAALTTALTQITHTGPTTPDYAIAAPVDSGVGSAWGFSTQDEFETIMSVILRLQERVDELESQQQSLGLLQ